MTRRGRKFAAGMAILALVLGCAAVFPECSLPRPVMKALVLSQRDWILRDYMQDRESGRLAIRLRQLLAGYIEHSLARHMVRRFAPLGDDDLKTITVLLEPLADLLANQEAVHHAPSSWPVLLSGIGYCDQLNGAAARLLALKFGAAQIFALQTAQGISNHSVGRVWSRSRNDWIYFDVYFDELILFEVSNGSVRLLVREKVGKQRRWTMPGPGELTILYQGVGRGRTLTQRHRYFWLDVFYTFFRDRAGPVGTQVVLPTPGSPVRRTWRSERVPLERANRIRSEYLSARVDHLLGASGPAAVRYRNVADSAREGSAIVVVVAADWFGRNVATK